MWFESKAYNWGGRALASVGTNEDKEYMNGFVNRHYRRKK